MKSELNHKREWVTPTIQDLDITDTKGGTYPFPIETLYDFPSFSGSGGFPPI